MTPILMIPVEVVALLCVACFAAGMAAGVFAVDQLRRKRDLFAMHREQYEPIEHDIANYPWSYTDPHEWR